MIEERSAEAPGDFATLIQCEVTTERKTYVAAGTLFGKQFLRLVRLGTYLLDAHLDGTLLVFTHRDRPGLIGFIGGTLGDEGVNIAQMNVGREQPGGEAIGVVNLDSAPSEKALETCGTNAHITEPERDQAPAAGSESCRGSAHSIKVLIRLIECDRDGLGLGVVVEGLFAELTADAARS